MKGGTARILTDIAEERRRQNAKWGVQDHPNGTGPNACWMYDDPETGSRLADQVRADTQRKFASGHGSWLDILLEEVAEAFAEDDPEKLRTELVQVAAVAVAWAESLDRRAGHTIEPTQSELNQLRDRVSELGRIVLAPPPAGGLISDHYLQVLTAIQNAFEIQAQLINAAIDREEAARIGRTRVLSEHEQAADARAEQWRRLVVDLTRCEHGRVQEDSCFDCPARMSPSQAGKVVGYGISGMERVVVPPRELMSDPTAWRQPI